VVESQEIYVPAEYQDAYEDGTRSLDGKAGADYWQNHSDYKINVTLDPLESTVNGTATIVYFNHSPDTLDRIVIRLYQNLNRAGTVKDFPLDEKDFGEGMVISSLTVNKKQYAVPGDTNLENTGTNLAVKDVTLLPGRQANINISWSFRVPRKNIVRTGQYDSTTFFIAYWYPQMAVYDDIDGWDMNEYTGTAEFYNDFNNYEVKITVPNNYGIWATGSLQNPEEVLSAGILTRYSQALVSQQVFNIITLADYTSQNPVFNSSSQSNTWFYKAKGVPDFTFGAAANYLWDARLADGGPGKKVFVSAAFNPATLDFYEVCEIACRTVEMMSRDLPGISFPFPSLTIFNGGGGMESPMMVNQGSSSERIWTVHTTVHEAAHSYFPFYMGINERKYAWMDEGFTQMLAEYVQFELDKTIDFRERNVKRYLDYAGQFDEIPMMYPSYMIRGEMYGNHAYFRPANALNVLKDFLGDNQFKKTLQEYMKRWGGKHPTPYDFFFTFEDVTDDDLDWFWQPWFFRQGYPDLAIDSVIVKEDLMKIQVTKEGLLPIPVAVTVKFKDGSSRRAYRSAAVWRAEDEDEIWIDMEIDKKPAMIELGSQYIPDVDSSNNIWIFR
jgi:hypothetical protein